MKRGIFWGQEKLEEWKQICKEDLLRGEIDKMLKPKTLSTGMISPFTSDFHPFMRLQFFGSLSVRR